MIKSSKRAAQSEPASQPQSGRRSFRSFCLGVIAGIAVSGTCSLQLRTLLLPAEETPPVKGSGGGNGNGRRAEEEEKATNNGPSLTDAMAAAFFSLDAATGHILFPDTVRQVVIDVGARESDYLQRLKNTDDRSTGLIMFDPMPHSYLPVAHSAADYQMRNRSARWLDTSYMNSVFPVRAALSDKEGTADFNIGIMPACGSLLEFKLGNAPHWCMASAQKIKAVILRLESIIDRIPPRIEDIHIKIDTEGFDLYVLKGAGPALRRARTVMIECVNYKTRESMPPGTFNCSDAVEYVNTLGTLEVVNPSSKGHGENLFWMQSNWTLPQGSNLPEFFRGPPLAFASFYTEVEKILHAKATAK